jgi:transposase-like protein
MTFIEAHCPACGRSFRESANHLCEGQVLSCPHCGQGWALSQSSPFDEILRLLRSGNEARRNFAEPRNGRLSAQSNRWYA